MRTIIGAAFASALLAGSAVAQQQLPSPPPECVQDAAGQFDHAACARAAPVGSPWRSLALINLATDAYVRHDYGTAVRYYDEARPPAPQQMFSDVMFHAFRGGAYWHVGRREDALADANIALRMLRRDPTLRLSPAEYLPAHADAETVYANILPILQSGDQAEFRAALAEFRGLPARDWVSYANRAATFLEIGDLPGALEMSNQALALAPTEAGVLNNHCYILYSSQRAAEALPYCERARAAAPGIPAVHDSISDVLVALGRCVEAERAIAEARRLDPSDPSYREPIVCTAAP